MKNHTDWTKFAAGDVEARDRLINEHLSLVYHVAHQLLKTLAAEANLNELVSSGVFGLMAALDTFEPERGLAFSTFAVPRIRGAILDELRRQDQVPRSIRRKGRELSRGREALMRVLGRDPTDRELADHLGVDTPTLWRWEADIEATVQVPLERTSAEGEDAMPSPTRFLTDNRDEGVDTRLTREEDLVQLRAAILGLKEQERTVLSLYYFEELKLSQIAQILGVSESRISQISAKAISRLRKVLTPPRAIAAHA
ncbi:MAG: FliA/WhiG family RNA polymerase sigma factor [bacterium]